MEQSLSHTKKILILVFLLPVVFLGFLYFLKNKGKENLVINNEKRCISDGLEVYYEKDKSGIPIFPLKVTIKNYKYFEIQDVKKQSSAVRLNDCNLYVIKGFGFDEKKSIYLESYSNELWKYDFDGKGEKIFQLNQNLKDGKYSILYKLFFIVDEKEKMIALVNKYLGDSNYALHIKDIETKQNVVEVNLTSDLFKKYPNVSGDVEFRGWSSDEKYFWFSLFDQANVLAFVKVDMSDSSYEVFEAPVGTMNQDAFNMETGWVTYDDGPPWTGVKEFDDEYQQEWEDAGDFVNFSLYNIFSKQKIDLEKTTDTTWWHYPKWLDDKTLEYKTSDGETKKYVLE